MVSHLGLSMTDLPALPAYLLSPGQPLPGKPTLPRHPIENVVVQEC